MEALPELLARLDAGALGDPLPVLAYIAGEELALPESERNGALRRALLLLAAGGDPKRELTVDHPAVKRLALDLHAPARARALAAALDGLAGPVRAFPRLRDALAFLAGEPDLAWRLYVLALLAEELGAESG